MAYDFIRGSTFNYTGTLQLTGNVAGGTYGVTGDQPDFSSYTVNAYMYDQSGEINYGSIPITNLATGNAETNGLYQITANAATTALWPVGKAQLIIQVIAADGSILIADPQWFRIKATPLVS